MVSKKCEMLFSICKGTHRSVRAVHQTWMKKLGRAGVVRLGKVPPVSAKLVNGEKLYAGLAWTESSTAFTCAPHTTKYRVHFVIEGYSLPDAIHCLSSSKPRFLQASSTNQDDLGAVADAVCGESHAVKEATGETFTLPGRSDEPEPGSPAALAQQSDRLSCSSRAARRSRKR